MAKLTAAQERTIETVLHHLNRAQEYIMKDSTILAAKKSHATTTLDFLLPDGTPATQIAKDIGSDLAGLQMGIDYLKNFLKFHAKDWS
jgi:hypothetical protein